MQLNNEKEARNVCIRSYIIAVFSTIFLPLALFFVDFKTTLILVAISHLIGNIGRINFFRHGLDKKMIITFGIPSILLSF